MVSDYSSYPFIHDDDGGRERVRSMVKTGFSYKEVLSLSATEQVNLVAEMLMADHAYERLFLVCKSYEMAMAVSTIVGMAGCLSRIVPHENSDAEKSYIVRIAPVSHESSLNQLLISLYSEYLKEHPEGIMMWDGKPSPLSLKTFYKRSLAEEYMGNLPFDHEASYEANRRSAISFLCGKADSGSALDALRSAFNHDGLSVPYADPVAQVWRMSPQPVSSPASPILLSIV